MISFHFSPNRITRDIMRTDPACATHARGMAKP
jgi:hypothetical protein